jgi:hypothetical protein
MRFVFFAVIPANAGIQFFFATQSWIPAFAGMTAFIGFKCSYARLQSFI